MDNVTENPFNKTEQEMNEAGAPAQENERVGIHFSEKQLDYFESDGKQLVSIKLPPVGDEPWISIVTGADRIRDDKSGHGKYTYLKKDADIKVRTDIKTPTGYDTQYSTMKGFEIADRLAKVREKNKERYQNLEASTPEVAPEPAVEQVQPAPQKAPAKPKLQVVVPISMLGNEYKNQSGQERRNVSIPTTDGSPWKSFTLFANQISINESGKSATLSIPEGVTFTVSTPTKLPDGKNGDPIIEKLTSEQIKGMYDANREKQREKSMSNFQKREVSKFTPKDAEKTSEPDR